MRVCVCVRDGWQGGRVRESPGVYKAMVITSADGAGDGPRKVGDEEPGELFSQEEGREEELKKRRTETKTNTRHQIHQGLWRGSAGRSRSGWDKPPEVQVGAGEHELRAQDSSCMCAVQGRQLLSYCIQATNTWAMSLSACHCAHSAMLRPFQ